MITESEIKQFEEVGAVTIDTPFTQKEIEGISLAFDRLMPFDGPKDGKPARFRVGQRYFLEPELLDVIQHPFLEGVAKKTLRAKSVHFWNTTSIVSYPESGAEFSFSEHVDVKYSLSDLDSVPKKMLCSCLLWLSDVNERRAPLMYRPGSHRLIAEEVEKSGTYINDPVVLREIPNLPFSDPVPLQAKAGQMTVCTTAMIHGPSINVDTEPRKVMFVVFEPDGFEIFANMKSKDERMKYYQKLKGFLRSDRLGILHPAA